jgi:hypothetical protein
MSPAVLQFENCVHEAPDALVCLSMLEATACDSSQVVQPDCDLQLVQLRFFCF